MRKLLNVRAFSSQVVRADEAAAAGPKYATLWETSDRLLAKQDEQNAGDAALLERLHEINTQEGAYKQLSTSSGDGAHLKSIKNQINKIVAQEMEQINFRNQVKQDELAAQTYQEVMTKQNFFFKVDENKKAKNLAL